MKPKDSFCSTFTNKPMNPNELKSAEEWIKDLLILIGTEEGADVESESPEEWNKILSFLKQIQLNAIKSAMTKAAEITKQGDGYEHKAGYWSEKILAARDKKARL